MTQALTVTLPPEARDLAAILDKTNKAKPDPADVRALRLALDKTPALWRVVGDLQATAYETVVANINASAALKESVRAGRLGLRAELGYSGAPALERLLIDHVALCWVRLQLEEIRHAQAREQEQTLTKSEYHDRCLTTAQARYLRSVETLARVRRLCVPALQVNIADKQVNIAGAAA